MFKGKDHVITCAAIVLWDGITKPEVDEKDGSLSHNIRVAIPNNAPELAELTQIANAALQASEFKGVLPPGGNWPFAEPDLAKMGPSLAGHTCFTAKTRRGVPGVFDVNGAELNAMTFARSFYPGAKVALYVHAYAYNNKQKGVAFGLDGIQVIDTTAPALAIGGGVSPQEVANAFASARPGGAASGPVMTAAAGATTYAAYIQAGWTDATLIAAGFMQAPVAAPPAAPPPPPAAVAPPPPAPPAAAPPPPAPPAAAPPPPAAVAPHTAILAGGPTMTAAAGATTYAAYIQAGWTDASLIAAGYMVAPAPAPAPLATAGSVAPPPPAPTAPAPVAGKVMLPAAGATTYDQYIGAGWTDAMLIQNGFMAAGA